MTKLIFDEITRRCIGQLAGGDGSYQGPGILCDVEEVPSEIGALWLDDSGQIREDVTALLEQAKQSRKTRIKDEASRLIAASDWKLQRAREREAAGWSSLAEVDAVLAEREAIRRSSSAAEAVVDAMTDVHSIVGFTWSVDVPVPAPRRLTHKQFMDRFTAHEAESVLMAAEVNPALKLFWQKMQMAKDINLDDPATVAGVNALEIAGLIGEGRTRVVLA